MVSYDRLIRIWSLEDFEVELIVLEVYEGLVISICFFLVVISLNEEEFVFIFILGSIDNWVILWDIFGNLLKEFI